MKKNFFLPLNCKAPYTGRCMENAFEYQTFFCCKCGMEKGLFGECYIKVFQNVKK